MKGNQKSEACRAAHAQAHGRHWKSIGNDVEIRNQVEIWKLRGNYVYSSARVGPPGATPRGPEKFSCRDALFRSTNYLVLLPTQSLGISVTPANDSVTSTRVSLQTRVSSRVATTSTSLAEPRLLGGYIYYRRPSLVPRPHPQEEVFNVGCAESACSENG